MAPAESCSAVADQPFEVDFEVAAREGRLWIRHRGRVCSDMADAQSCHWTDFLAWRELFLKGVSWSGFNNPSTNCPEELGGFEYFRPMSEYLDVLTENHFNAVRLPLHARGILDNPMLNENRCGRLGHSRATDPVRSYNQALLEVVRQLAHSGQFVMLDMHSIDGASITIQKSLYFKLTSLLSECRPRDFYMVRSSALHSKERGRRSICMVEASEVILC